MARETLADLCETIAILREILDAQYLVSVGDMSGSVPASLREIAQCAAEGNEIRVYSKA